MNFAEFDPLQRQMRNAERADGIMRLQLGFRWREARIKHRCAAV
jgi:hypothetical protein